MDYTKALLLFPGQGSQSVGMAKALLDLFPQTSQIFEEAEDALKLSLRRLCLEGPADELQLTANQQPAILTVSMAYWSVFQAETPLADAKPRAVFAGHSLGEYSALVASGKLPFVSALRLVRERGLAMQEAVPVGVGAMAAVLRANEEGLVSLCAEITEEQGFGVVEVVNFNNPEQHIISGHLAAVDEVGRRLAASGQKVIFKKLPVSAPFHSSLMTKAREHMAPLLRSAPFQKTSETVIPNLTGQIEGEYSPEHLIQQIDHPVLWTKSMATAEDLGVSLCLEVGPGNVLSGLAKRCFQRSLPIIQGSQLEASLAQLSS